MKGVQGYELFGGIALKNHVFFLFILLILSHGIMNVLYTMYVKQNKYVLFSQVFSVVIIIVYLMIFTACLKAVCVLPLVTGNNQLHIIYI